MSLLASNILKQSALKTTPIQLNLLKNVLTPQLSPLKLVNNFGTKITPRSKFVF